MRREYRESLLVSEGKLCVSSDDWHIEYYFPGPDLRYNGTFVRIPGDGIEDFVKALYENWARYLELSETIPAGGEFSESGLKGMTIRVGGFRSGVCLRGYNGHMGTEQKLVGRAQAYLHARDRALEIQRTLLSTGETPAPELENH